MATRTPIPMSAKLVSFLHRCEKMREAELARAKADEPAPTRWAASSPALVDFDEVAHWQDTFELPSFPADLLALEALGIDGVGARVSVPLAPLPLEKTYRQKLSIPDGHVVIGVARGAGKRESIAVARDGLRDENPALVVLSADGARETDLFSLLEERLADEPGWAKTTAGKDTTLAPAVINRRGAASLGRRVTHVKFGEGVVLGEVAAAKPEDTKLEIEFDDVGKKVLMARFVKDIAAGGATGDDDGEDPGPRLADGPFRDLAKATATKLGMTIAPDFIKALSSVPRAVFAEKLYWNINHPGLWLEAGRAIAGAGWLEDKTVRNESVKEGNYRGPPGIAIGRAAGGEILCLVAKNKRGGGPLERLAQMDHESLELEPVGGTFGSAEDLWNVLRESGILTGD